MRFFFWIENRSLSTSLWFHIKRKENPIMKYVWKERALKLFSTSLGFVFHHLLKIWVFYSVAAFLTTVPVTLHKAFAAKHTSDCYILSSTMCGRYKRPKISARKTHLYRHTVYLSENVTFALRLTFSRVAWPRDKHPLVRSMGFLIWSKACANL